MLNKPIIKKLLVGPQNCTIDKHPPAFSVQKALVCWSLQGLLHEDSTIQELDLRGNGLTKDDVTLGEFFGGCPGINQLMVAITIGYNYRL